MYSIEDLPKGKAVVALAEGIYIKKIKDVYFASKKAPNMLHFTKSIKLTKEDSKSLQSLENASKFDNSDDLLLYLNDMKTKKFNKEKHLQKALNVLPSDQKKAIIQGILDEPNLKIGVQKSLTLGFMDLPLFGGIEDKQQRLF